MERINPNLIEPVDETTLRYERQYLRLCLARVELNNLQTDLHQTDTEVTPEHISSLTLGRKIFDGALAGLWGGIRHLEDREMKRACYNYNLHLRDIMGGVSNVVLFPDMNRIRVPELLLDFMAVDYQNTHFAHYRRGPIN